jgi:alpha-L-rhamnosidase
MKKHIEYMLTLCDGLIPTRCLCHGDWLSVYETTDKRVYSTLYLAHAANILSKICRIVGDRDEGYYIDLFLRVKRAFKEAFVDEDGKIESDTQCCYILALAFGVLSDDDVREHLRRKFLQYGNKLTAGFHGAKYALEALCKAGLQDIAYTVITNTEYPSWGYSIENGATTIWERWDGYKKDGMHKDPMNSFNHFVFGSAGYWLFEGMLGITPEEDGAGFKKITVRPYLDKRIATGQGAYDSPNGLISVSFAYGGGGFDYTIALPKAMQVKFDFVQEVESIVEETDGKTKTYRVRLKERV